MGSATKVSLGIITIVANVVLSQVGAMPLGILDVISGAAVLVSRLGLTRVFVGGAVFFALAAAAVPRGGCTRERAFEAAVRSDLKNLATQQEIFYADNDAYTTSFEDLGYVTSEGVDVALVASRDGWSAVGTHAALGDATGCAIYSGHAPKPTIAGLTPSAPDALACTD